MKLCIVYRGALHRGIGRRPIFLTSGDLQSALYGNRAPAALNAVLLLSALLLPLTAFCQDVTTSAAPAEPARPRATTSTAPATNSAPAPAALSAPTGYILSPNDQVAVEVFGEEDLRTNGRLNGEGNF